MEVVGRALQGKGGHSLILLEGEGGWEHGGDKEELGGTGMSLGEGAERGSHVERSESILPSYVCL